ncbi:MAG: DALR anticodon-binding domain-containing protein, partial [Oscillospiraceae bacterium]|nr:DALR anticodon-binding domain-containing protein [Oscillospiraceae bacterium]
DNPDCPFKPVAPKNVTQLLFTEPAELELIRKLAVFTEEVADAARAFDPSRLTRYITETAQLFHKFYDSCRVKGESDGVIYSRLSLMQATATVIKNALGIMKVEAPERM